MEKENPVIPRFLYLLVLSTGVAAAASLQTVPLDSDRWQVQAEESSVVEHLGRSSLFLKNGVAWVKDSEFTDGILEFDVAFADQRGFMGGMWRIQDEGNYEEFYVRPHQSGKPDANQYTPAFGGLASWQLYHGSGYGAPVEYRFDQWNQVRVVVSGAQAEVYINDMTTPVLFIPEQKRAIRPGRVGIKAFVAPAYFSSFRFQAGDPPAFRSAPPKIPEAKDGTIMSFEVSDAFSWNLLQGKSELPSRVASARSWTELACENSGLANLARINARGEKKDTVFARVLLTSEREQTVSIRFGFSDLVRVYLNSRILYAGDNGYRSRDYRYLGTIGYFDQVYLPLQEGENHLWFAVAENFGGWGLQVILTDAKGVVVGR